MPLLLVVMADGDEEGGRGMCALAGETDVSLLFLFLFCEDDAVEFGR